MVWTMYNVCVRNSVCLYVCLFVCLSVCLYICLNLSVCLSVCLSARQQRYDVVLIDTAGRMQDNEPLMRALAKVLLAHSSCHYYNYCMSSPSSLLPLS